MFSQQYAAIFSQEAVMIKKDTNIIRRSRTLHHGRRGNGPVIYWMERDQRLADNWALLFARQEAIIREKPLNIVFCLPPQSPAEQAGKQSFQLHGLAQLQAQALALNFGFAVFSSAAETLLPRLAHASDCNLLVTDFSPLSSKQKQCRRIGKEIDAPLVEVDAHNIIPCWKASDKKEYAAYTLRPKIQRLLDDFLTDFPQLTPHPHGPAAFDCLNLSAKTESLPRQKTVVPTGRFIPGCKEADARMLGFQNKGLHGYDKLRNDPNKSGQSDLSPYLHFGQLAPQRLALTVTAAEAPQQDKESFLEELIIRRELADNFCFYERHYDAFAGFPEWAQKSHNEHRDDKRAYLYDQAQLENGETHEPLWNNCQHNLVTTHKLHGFLRMYWAKKILEWTNSPEEALYYANYLNDTYSLDGCDPNGYTGTAWSIGGVHDRAWREREVFGKIRYMNEKGCRRKFKVDDYIAKQDKISGN